MEDFAPWAASYQYAEKRHNSHDARSRSVAKATTKRYAYLDFSFSPPPPPSYSSAEDGPTVIWSFPELESFNSSLAKIRSAREQAALNVLLREISAV